MIALDCRARETLSPHEATAVASTVRAGGAVVFPTDTLYGLGADPFSAAGVAMVFRIKGRSAEKTLLVLIEGPELLGRFAAAVPAPWEALMRAFWPGPLTLLFPALPRLPAGIRSPEGEVALRVPGSPLCRAVLRAAGGCLTGTSANRAGEGSFSDGPRAARALGGLADLFVNAGTLTPSRESTLLRVDVRGEVEMVREGAVGRGEIERVVGASTGS